MKSPIRTLSAQEDGHHGSPEPLPPQSQKKKRRRIRFETRVSYIYSSRHGQLCNLLPVHKLRDAMIWALLESCEWTQKLRVIPPAKVQERDLLAFHDRDYLHSLLHSQVEKRGVRVSATLEEFALVDDCYLFPGICPYVFSVVGASLAAAKELALAKADIAISWSGGRHHAKRERASGFCYVNDVVLSVLSLQELGLKRVLCVDLDIHHGDGTEEAFAMSPSVYTVSFHKCATGYFPGTGQQKFVGRGKGRYCNMNIPLEDGLTDDDFEFVQRTVLEPVVETFQPHVIVAVCGVDTLGKDPLGTFNVTAAGLVASVELLKGFGLPLLLLGGGGYNVPESCKAFALMTAAAIGRETVESAPTGIPEHHFFPKYGPDFQFRTQSAPHRVNKNTKQSLSTVCDRALRQLEKYKAQQC